MAVDAVNNTSARHASEAQQAAVQQAQSRAESSVENRQEVSAQKDQPAQATGTASAPSVDTYA